MRNVYITDFRVTGRGRFPLDMLRYDCCYPLTGDDVSALEVPNNPEEYMNPRSILLRMTSQGKSGPTVDRWNSFGWSVDRSSVRRL